MKTTIRRTMTLRDLLKKPFWSPKDLSLATGISITTSRKIIAVIRKELESEGYINLDNSKAPTPKIITRLNIDIGFLTLHDGLDKELETSE